MGGDRGEERPPELGPLVEFFAGRRPRNGALRTPPRPTCEMLAWIGGQARAATTRFTEASRLEVIASRLPVPEWPDRPLLLTAVDTLDGSFVSWGRAAGVPLPVAVAASCAVPWVYPPVSIGGRRYMDGGVRSSTNADLARGHDLVVILAPMGATPATSRALEEEVSGLRAGGSRVEVVVPDASALEQMGSNPLDPARRAGAAAAGLSQAPSVAASLTWIRGRLPV